uniref:Pancreatic hormone n=1 Tax=Macrostomum lignano TaxID=282301 RepID=A0A1I8GYL4_9PLAT
NLLSNVGIDNRFQGPHPAGTRAPAGAAAGLGRWGQPGLGQTRAAERPERPRAEAGPRELEFKEYLKNLRSYMSLIARPRFGKRSDTP